jgi:hypothetical protein
VSNADPCDEAANVMPSIIETQKKILLPYSNSVAFLLLSLAHISNDPA